MAKRESTGLQAERPDGGQPWAGLRISALKDALEDLYTTFNHRREIHPDPLEFVYRFDNARDQEVVGLIAACLAYGRVAHILQNVAKVLAVLGPSPCDTLLRADRRGLTKRLHGFRHRWTSSSELVDLLLGIRSALIRHGSLESCFLRHHESDSESTLPGLTGFAQELRGSDATSSLLSAPEKGSACKRLHLYLRWMVRSDGVDPGCWQGVKPAQLIVPMDTHMFRVARALRMTDRKQANLSSAIDTTRAFRSLSPDDPVRYDFALTRLGIRADMDLDDFLGACRKTGQSANPVRKKTPGKSARQRSNSTP